MDRINVVGTSCSGKTTLARRLATLVEAPHVELDALFWGPSWEPVPDATFRRRVTAASAEPRWVIDGGYSVVRPIIWDRADTVVWLDFPMPIVLARWARRTIARIRSGEEFWPGTGNRESFRNALRRDGLLTWIVSTHHRRRRTMAAQLAARPEIIAVRVGSPSETDRWLADVARDRQPSG